MLTLGSMYESLSLILASVLSSVNMFWLCDIIVITVTRRVLLCFHLSLGIWQSKLKLVNPGGDQRHIPSSISKILSPHGECRTTETLRHIQ
jgi:hypothetical protein